MSKCYICKHTITYPCGSVTIFGGSTLLLDKTICLKCAEDMVDKLRNKWKREPK